MSDTKKKKKKALAEKRNGVELGEIIYVDDNSRDGSVETVEELQKEGFLVRFDSPSFSLFLFSDVIHSPDPFFSDTPRPRMEVRTKERGLSSAVVHGFKMAKHEILLVRHHNKKKKKDYN